MLIEALRSDRPEERERATRALKRLGGAAVDAVEPLTQDPDAEVAWRAQQLTSLIGPQYSSDSFTYPSDDYAYVVFGVLALLVTVVVAWYALTLKDRSLGGAMLLGWLVTEIFVFLSFITQGWFNRHRTVADNILVSVLLIASVVLTLVYMRRRQTVP